ncbi:SusD/RagB family nutrient-binding outer membrane lipoprotein [Adhaeribacter radiodurans]|uniref:SusD/RagB family nutrient-binding outer membrane lipoprotein n=1 Tax=Adhaeribacter radiodurans TaxID=2745197 RepID=A0A7L7L2J1_9BACT|nr:SusD/RagB family nutrient-binding outer membrane lipoprotein [Adhaeribacter radiodurans]QMU26980.1 SusD/RagB family nutrient-binding outer membrane lipoprotein [Adhaeribacter radiodurans]
MKYIHKIILGTMGLVVPLAGCDTDELHNLNVNPQAVNQIDLNYLFTASELGIASNGSAGDNRFIDWRTNIGMTAYAIQHLANAGGGIAPGDKYQDNFETASAPFEFTYNDQLKNIAEILKQTGPGGFAEGKYQNMRNAARIVRAFSFHRLTDFYGNVPYFEANQGMEGIFFPKYDKQSAIYADLLKELDEASTALSATNPDEGFAKADFIYEGDVAKWKRWGNSLMLRLAMRISNVAPELSKQYVTKAVAGGVFTSNADNVWVKMGTGPSQWINQNGISRAFYPGDGGQPSYLSKTLVDFLKGTNQNSVADDDPRLMILSGGIADWSAAEWKPINTDPLAQKGMPNGLDQSGLDALEGGPVDQAKTYSRINFLMLQLDDPYMIMNYGEVELLLAEALERGIGSGITGTAAEHYNAGVKASMQMYTPYDASLIVSDAQVATYLAAYPYGSAKGALPMIYEQLWVNKFFNWWEAWSDWRRTEYPQLTPVNYQGNVTNGTIPVRLKYPSTEAAGNQNYATGATKPDTYTTKVWWDGGTE